MLHAKNAFPRSELEQRETENYYHTFNALINFFPHFFFRFGQTNAILNYILTLSKHVMAHEWILWLVIRMISILLHVFTVIIIIIWLNIFCKQNSLKTFFISYVFPVNVVPDLIIKLMVLM